MRWFQLFVVDSFGELSKSTGYRDKHLDLNGYGVGGLLYPPRTLPMWQNSFQVCKNRFFDFPLLKSDRILAIFTTTSSVTKRNIMDRMDMALGMVYTPHQWTYSDRNDSYREKSTFSFPAANLSRTGQCFQHGKGVSLVPWYEDTHRPGRPREINFMSRYICFSQNGPFDVSFEELFSKAKNPGGFFRKIVF